MLRALPVCAVLLALPFVGWAGAQPEPTETVIRLKVQPAPAPKPALRYQLLPALSEMEPGNAILGYLKCFIRANNFFGKEGWEKLEKWGEMPVKNLPVKEVRAAGYRNDAVLFRTADYAARLDHADWQALLPMRREGYNLLIPEVQEMRSLGTALVIRLRADVAERHFDDALFAAKTSLALARHVGEYPTLIGFLIGTSLASITLNPLEEMLQQPGCPNLYWALTDLPDPLISLRRAMQGDRMILDEDFAGLDASNPMTDAQLAQVAERISRLLREVNRSRRNPKQQDPRDWLDSRAKDQAHLRTARRGLVAYGLPEDRVQQFPPLQVVLLDAKLAYESEHDEAYKAVGLPFWQAEKVIAAGQSAKSASKDALFVGLAPQMMIVGQARARLQQRIGLLRCVEALRMHAAENDGRLPARLENLKVPVPIDPFTGKSFAYRLEGGTATVRGTPPPGREKNASYNVRYEVTIVK